VGNWELGREPTGARRLPGCPPPPSVIARLRSAPLKRRATSKGFQFSPRGRPPPPHCPPLYWNGMASSGGDPSGFIGRGACVMSTAWRDKQHPNLINFIASFLAANSYRLNFRSVSPDFLFNNGGTSVAFVFETNWSSANEAAVFSRVNTLKRQFKHLYVVVVVPTGEANESFNQSYFKYGMELGCPTFVPVCDPEMGFEKIVKIAHARGVCRQQDITTTMKNERAQAVQCMDAFLRVLTSIPGIDGHDANALAQAIGSIEAIAKASKEYILENTDLSTEKAERIVRFFRDPQYYLSPKIN
ncbi:unnamed protein product, partial [Urochloa humidicola]